MKFDSNKAEAWINAIDRSLVGLKNTAQNSKSPILLLGAGVLELYAELGWIAPLRRGKTGDLDLSVGLVASSSEYAEFIKAFKALKYRPDKDHPYRWHEIRDGNWVHSSEYDSNSQVHRNARIKTLRLSKLARPSPQGPRGCCRDLLEPR